MSQPEKRPSSAQKQSLHLLLLRVQALVNPELSFAASSANVGFAAFQRFSCSSPPAVQLVHCFREIPSMVCQKRNLSQDLSSASAEKAAPGWSSFAPTSDPFKLVPLVKVWFHYHLKVQKNSLFCALAYS